MSAEPGRFNPWAKYADRPMVEDRRELPRVRREWKGERVCIRYIRERGSAHQRTQIRYAFGTLVDATREDQIGVLTKDGHKDIHYRRVTVVWNLSRTKDSGQ